MKKTLDRLISGSQPVADINDRFDRTLASVETLSKSLITAMKEVLRLQQENKKLNEEIATLTELYLDVVYAIQVHDNAIRQVLSSSIPAQKEVVSSATSLFDFKKPTGDGKPN